MAGEKSLGLKNTESTDLSHIELALRSLDKKIESLIPFEEEVRALLDDGKGSHDFQTGNVLKDFTTARMRAETHIYKRADGSLDGQKSLANGYTSSDIKFHERAVLAAARFLFQYTADKLEFRSAIPKRIWESTKHILNS